MQLSINMLAARRTKRTAIDTGSLEPTLPTAGA